MCNQCKYTTWDIRQRQTYIVNYHIYKKSTRKIAGLILIHKNKVLLVRSYKHWGFPKGALRPCESSFEGACRELVEETGLNLNLPEKAFQKWCPTLNSTFYIKVINDVLEDFKPRVDRILIDSSNDTTGVGWFKINCVNNLVTADIMISNRYLKFFIERTRQFLKYKKKLTL